MRIAIATCLNLPEPDVDEELLLAALRERGVDVRMLPWDGPDAPAPDETVIVRSTWNYYRDVAAFLAWVERTAATNRLRNPASILRWNVDKTYLRKLAEDGVPIVPTEWETHDVARAMDAHGWKEVVLKPVVSAGSFTTKRFTRGEAQAAQAFADGAGRAMMMQRWMPAVDTSGERSIVWIDGAVSHAIRKSPRFHGGHESVTSVAIADDERALAEKILAPYAAELLYARVDVIRDGDDLRLMELELVEPSLFLKQHPPALARLADAISR